MKTNMRGSASRRLSGLILQINLLLLALVRDIGGSDCTVEQIESCKTSVKGNSLDKLPGGGECQAKRYVEFTHLCTVNNYVPSTDYCCCAHAHKTLCCRYHYDWNYFRCSEGRDTVDIESDESLPQEILLTAILVPTAVALCCVICCIRCLCCRDDEDDTPCGCSKCHEKDNTVEKFTVGRSKRYKDARSSKKSSFFDTKIPLTNSKHEEVVRGMTSLCNGAVPSVPSAPPMEDPALAHLLSSTSPQPTTLANFTSGNAPASQSNNSGYYLHYVPLQLNQNTSTKPADCTYQEIRPPSTVVPNTYQVDTRFTGSGNCCHGNPSQTQTLIGILTKPDGTAFVTDPSMTVPRDPPPYEDACSEIFQKSSEKDANAALDS